MTLPRDHSFWLHVATMISIVLAGQSARGQDDEEKEIVVDVVPLRVAREDVVKLQRQRVLLLQNRNLERWIAGKFGDVAALRAHLKDRLDSRLDALQVTCHLTELQRNKLELAGRGDIKRLLDRLDSLPKKWAETNVGDFQSVTSDTRDLQEDIEKPFEADSLFSKTLVRTLTPEQVLQNDNALRDKNSARYRDVVAQTVRRLARLLNLSSKQRDDLATLILTETMAPSKFGQSEYAFVMFQASRLPEAKLRAIFDERQWNTIKWQLASWGDSEKNLRDEGFEFLGRPKEAGPAGTLPHAGAVKSRE